MVSVLLNQGSASQEVTHARSTDGAVSSETSVNGVIRLITKQGW